MKLTEAIEEIKANGCTIVSDDAGDHDILEYLQAAYEVEAIAEDLGHSEPHFEVVGNKVFKLDAQGLPESVPGCCGY